MDAGFKYKGFFLQTEVYRRLLNDFVPSALSFGNAMASMTDFLFSGVLVRFPQLTLAYSEGQMGWVPYVIERADDVWEQHRAWAGVSKVRVSWIRRQILNVDWCPWRQRFPSGARNR